MSKTKLKNKCRTCLNSSKGLQLLTKMANEEKMDTKTYGDLLKDLTHIEVRSKNDFLRQFKTINMNKFYLKIMDESCKEMPQSICAYCIRKLKSAYAFVQQAQEVNDKLWVMLKDNNGEDLDDENKHVDCLQEAQIDIQNCLEIKMEDDEATENNKQDSTKFEMDLKLEDSEDSSGLGNRCSDKIVTTKINIEER